MNLVDIKNAHFESIVSHFDSVAAERGEWIKRNRYFYQREVKALQRYLVSSDRVLEVGCGNGDLLGALDVQTKVGVDISPKMIETARQRHPGIEFHTLNAEDSDALASLDQKFDFIVISDLIGYSFDIHDLLRALQGVMGPRSRVVICYHNRWWEPLFKLWMSLGKAMPRPVQNWFSIDDIRDSAELAGFEVLRVVNRELSPVSLFGIGTFVNRFIAPLPLINALCWRSHVVLSSTEHVAEDDPTVTVLIPCRNEEGNIQDCVDRLPVFGRDQELLFVEGNSSDGTYERCLEMIDLYPDRTIRVLKQPGKGKNDAVRLGFREAAGDVVMILDSDLAVPPEYLPRVYGAFADGQADFVNGSRLVYPLEKGAMRPLNYVANRLFAFVLSYLLDHPLSDTLCGTKALYKKDYLEIESYWERHGSLDPFGDFDLIFGAAEHNLKFLEIPVRYYARSYGEPQISRFADGFLLFRMVFAAYMRLKAL